MTRRPVPALLAACAALSAAATLTTADDARACGGCFTQPNGESTIVSAHRMAIALSTKRTVLWDQIRYQGDPEEFAWVLPVKAGTTIQLGSDAFFEALDAATTVHVNPPPDALCDGYYYDGYDDGSMYWGGCAVSGCGASGNDSRGPFRNDVGDATPIPPVEVVHQESIGPYEAVILSSNQPGALYDWLFSHGFAVEPGMEPIIDSYEADGFDFVALRLIPGAGTGQMRPVRVISPGASPVLPLRMVAAGTGENVAMTLFVLGEGRWQPQNFPSSLVNQARLQWNFTSASSTYGVLRDQALASGDGSSWLTTYARQGSLFSPVANPAAQGNNVLYQPTDGSSVTTIADLYARQGFLNGETSDTECTYRFQDLGNSTSKVVNACSDGSEASGGSGGAISNGGSGGSGGSGEPAPCPHDACDLGESLSSTCNLCVAQICYVDPYCCNGKWDDACVQQVGTVCGQICGFAKEECDGELRPDELDARDFACGDLDDLAVALVGMRPTSLWLTRLEANLPRASLAQDLLLQPASQDPVENWLLADSYSGDPCTTTAIPPSPRARPLAPTSPASSRPSAVATSSPLPSAWPPCSAPPPAAPCAKAPASPPEPLSASAPPPIG